MKIRLLILALLLWSVPAPVSAAPATAYGGFRVVRASPGTPSTPVVSLPGGYEVMSGATASRAEFFAFVRGPSATAVTVTVSWPGQWITDVISGKAHVPVEHDAADPFTVRFPIPVTGASVNQNTLQVYSYPSGSTATGVYWRIEHNDPDRVAGPWTSVAWPGNQAASVINYMVAANLVLQDSGLAAEARRRGHFFALMGFETNNPLHPDNPPHWHLSYYPGLTFGAAGAHVPHFWVDAAGRTFYNGMDVQGRGRGRFYVGDPAEIRDPAGALIITMTIRADGGLDLRGPDGRAYSITSAGGDFGAEVRVLRDGAGWRWVRSGDSVTGGVLVTHVGGLGTEAFHQTLVYRYDRLTGTILAIHPS
ncbi:hypothetical protein J2S43_000762 [Catenuloplanes nepalensis]|uniref:Uncharacterized protein n=1 Tax=Catenuloplanes nepalensis TaxID=587533 RepID=A0ABT9MLF2_9ACTN|nr:hypothetical protein [Catenuloplanes nepalensis]MDP9792250.1 hypothetical protein [Catenuloplanes nepalensis]